MFKRSWVRIAVPYTGWTFFTLICCTICIVCLKRPKLNEKEAWIGTFFRKTITTILYSLTALHAKRDHYDLLRARNGFK